MPTASQMLPYTPGQWAFGVIYMEIWIQPDLYLDTQEGENGKLQFIAISSGGDPIEEAVA